MTDTLQPQTSVIENGTPWVSSVLVNGVVYPTFRASSSGATENYFLNPTDNKIYNVGDVNSTGSITGNPRADLSNQTGAFGSQANILSAYNSYKTGTTPSTYDYSLSAAGNGTNVNPNLNLPPAAPTVPSTIGSANTEVSPIPSLPSAPTPTNTGGVVTGANSYVASTLPPPVQPYTDKSTDLLNEIQGLYTQDQGKTAYTASQLDASGATALEAKQKDLAARLNAINLQDQAIPLQMEQNATGQGLTTGILDRQTQEARRQNAIGALSIQAEYAINAGQLDTARIAAQRAVDLKYADIESEIDQKIKLLSLYSPFMSAEQQQQATAQANDLANQIAETAANKQLQLDLVNYAQSSGDTARMSQLLALDPSNPNFKTQLGGIAGAITPKIPGATTTYTDEGGRRYAITLDAQGNVLNKADIGASSNAGTTSATVEDSTGKYIVTLDSSGKVLNKVKVAEATPTATTSGTFNLSPGETRYTTDSTGKVIPVVTAPTAAQTTNAPTATQTALQAFPTVQLTPGQSGADVTALQNALVGAGLLDKSGVTGTYDAGTMSAVLALQKKLGIDYSSGPGYFGPKTISAIQAGAKPTTLWSDPYMLGGNYVQKNSQTGEIRTAVNPDKPTTPPAPYGTPTTSDISNVLTALAKQPPSVQSTIDKTKLQSDPSYFYWVKAQLGI